MIALQNKNIQLVCSKNEQLIKRAMEYCVNITKDHHRTGMQQVHTQCDPQTQVNIFKFIIKRDIVKL